jgi:hypothetical protein
VAPLKKVTVLLGGRVDRALLANQSHWRILTDLISPTLTRRDRIASTAMIGHRYAILIAALLLLGALPCAAAAGPRGDVAARLERLARTPEAKAQERKALSEAVSASWRPSLKQFLASGDQRLTGLQDKALKLAVSSSSPKYRSLRVALLRHRMKANRIPQLIGYLTLVHRNSAVRQMVRHGEWLRAHPAQLRTALGEYRLLAESDEVEPLARSWGSILSGRGATAYFKQRAPMIVASLLTPAQLARVNQSLRAAAPSSLDAKGFCQKAAQGAEVLLAEKWAQFTTSLNATMSAAEQWAQSHRPEIRQYLGNALKTAELLSTWFQDGAVAVAKGVAVELWLVPYGRDKIIETSAIIGKQLPKTPTRQAPGDPDMDGHRRVQGDLAYVGGLPCLGDEPGEGGTPEGDKAPDTLTVEPKTLKRTVPGAWYSQKLSAQGGTGSLTWSATGLPAGLSISTNGGEIEGWTQSLGESKVQVTVRDSAGNTGSTNLDLISEPPTCSGNPCADAYGHSQVTVAWTCGCVNPFPTEFHGLFGYFLEPYVNGVAGGHFGSSFVLGPLSINAPDGSQGVPVFAGPGGLLWYTYPHNEFDLHFAQAPPDVMALKVYFIAKRNVDEELTAFPIGMTNVVLVQ